MKKLTFILCLFWGIFEGNAQSIDMADLEVNRFGLSRLPETMDVDSEKFKETYEGIPFLDKEWQPGSVTMTSGEVVKYSMRYFVYGEQIWLKDETDSVYNLNLSDKIAGIIIAGKHFIYTGYVAGNKSRAGILEVLYNGGNGRLLNLHSCEIKKGREANGYQNKEKDKFQHKEILYYQLGEDNARVLPRSKKEFFPIFGDKAGVMEKYFKDNKLKMNTEGFSKAFAHYDEIK